ncbi:MAG: hypothetical protein ABIO79_04710 [Ferruginibacter sp.]
MNRICLLITAFFIAFTISSCSRKNHPTETATTTPKTVRPKTIKTAVPKVITVNDKYAKRSVDGRYYYDLEGRRYWRNNKDGKYYLFNKSMFDDEAFKSPGKN